MDSAYATKCLRVKALRSLLGLAGRVPLVKKLAKVLAKGGLSPDPGRPGSRCLMGLLPMVPPEPATWAKVI